MKYKVYYRETCQMVATVEADSPEEAEEIILNQGSENAVEEDRQTNYVDDVEEL